MTQVEALKAIARRDGGLLRPGAVVEAARDESSPLHGAFCWDDTEAAHRYRLIQAQRLIRTFEIECVDGKRKYNAPMFVNLSVDRNGASSENPYRLAEDVAKREDLLAVAEADALDQLNALKTRYQHLKRLGDIWAAIEAHAK